MECAVKVMLKDEEGVPCMGPGVAWLLEEIDKEGNVSVAARNLTISYSKCWKMIRNAEAGFGVPLVERTTGGMHGGHACLTQAGKEALARFQELEKDIREYAQRSYEKVYRNR